MTLCAPVYQVPVRVFPEKENQMMLQFVSHQRVGLFFFIVYALGMGNDGECYSRLSFVVRSHQRTLSPKKLRLWVNNDPYSELNVDIEKIILTLSNVADDQSRREKLSQLFELKLQNQDGGELFMTQFNSAMITVGDRIRVDAANVAAAVMGSQSSNSTNSDEDSVSTPSLTKSQLEGQLWACVDMMVQSKTLMKQARLK